MRAALIPRALEDLRERIYHNDAFIEWIGNMLLQQYRHVPATDLQRATAAAQMVQNMRRALRHAECFHVTEDMTTLVSHAAASLDDSDKTDFTLAPSISGLVHFEGPGLLVRDPRGMTMRINWILWHPATWQDHLGEIEGEWHGYMTWEFNDAAESPDEIEDNIARQGYARTAHRVYGRWGFIGSTSVRNDDELGAAMMMPSIASQMSILLDGDVVHEGTNTTRYLHALWLLMNQTVADRREIKPHPSQKKAAKARGQRIPKLTIIELRRRVREGAAEAGSVGGDHAKREYTCQWIVRGFWRWQRYGEGRKERRRIWIEPHIRGPVDKPLRGTEHVYTLKR